MASYFHSEYKCKCGAKPVKITFKRPPAFGTALISHHCKDCDKKSLMKVYKDLETNSYKVKYAILEA